jgi:hypothetical protein
MPKKSGWRSEYEWLLNNAHPVTAMFIWGDQHYVLNILPIQYRMNFRGNA